MINKENNAVIRTYARILKILKWTLGRGEKEERTQLAVLILYFVKCSNLGFFSSHSPSLNSPLLQTSSSSHFLKHFKVYEEAGSDFHQVAYFKTRIGLRNALREEISGSSDREAVLITLNRPIVFAQPVAFDRGIVETIATS